MGAEVHRVLIADADAGIRQQLFSGLLELDIFSDCVSTTQDAIEKLEKERYGLLVIDVALPSGNVEDVIACVQQMVPAQRPVVLVLAAKPEAARTLDVDIVQIVLRRPVILRQLIDLVRSCLRSAGGRVVQAPQQTNPDQLIS
jgi:two-component system response regulator ResD